MRRSIWTRVLAVLLVISMTAAPVSAAGYSSKSSRGWGSWFGGSTVTKPTQPEKNESVMTLVEDATTVDNGEGLRASTYVLTNGEDSAAVNAASVNTYSVMAAASDTAAQATGTTVKYFPVTMYNYDESTINSATHAADMRANSNLTEWQGLYFNGGNPGAESFTYTTSAGTFTDLTWAQVQSGTYYVDEACTTRVTVTPIVQGSEGYAPVRVSIADLWGSIDGAAADTYCKTNYYFAYSTYEYCPVYVYHDSKYGDYELLYERYGMKYTIDYYNLGDSADLYEKAGTVIGYTLTAGGSTLASLDGTDTSAKVGITLYTTGGTATTGSLEFAAWNFWGKRSNAGDLIYTGLVQSEMVNDQIVFNVPEGGIFNNDTSVKNIYEYVGLPFVLGSDGYYTFNSNEHTAYFADSNPQSGSIDASGNITAHNLTFDETTQGWSGMNYGDGSRNLWAPFNTNANDNSENAIDYHFGMRADLPFSMTANGRVKSTDNESDPVVFSFSGDDDVWVFIDGHLVIDLGGIHNRLDATINFATNTITYSEENTADSNNNTASFNNTNFATTQKLFTDSEGTGVINQTLDAFALDPDHEMQVFYLERGKGASNCRIKFNLPMNDTVLVTKDATRSWNSNSKVEEDLTDSEQAAINEMDFGFTLYKKAAGETGFTAVKNTNFYLVGRAVDGVVINATDNNGHFYLKNGQSAKFITEIPTEGVTYYVVEDKVPDGFVSPDFRFAGKAAYDYSYTGVTASDEDTTNTTTASGTAPAENASEIGKQVIPTPETNTDGSLTWAQNKSYEITVKGSVEFSDSIEFICSNYMDATLPNPSVYAREDIIVIDYGLSVPIDPLVNDLFRGDEREILYVGGADVTLTTETTDSGLVTGKWTEDNTLDFGTVQLVKGTATETDKSRDTLVYTLNKQLTEVEVLTYIVKTTGNVKNAAGEDMTNYAYSMGKVYIVPATVMYYEEDFSGLVKFTGSNWQNTVTTAGASEYQEPGVAGTTTDSIYGSDVAYLNDSFDSNGTSYYGDTTNGAIKFEYTFTGTGTSIFARTSATTGYLQIKLYEGTDTSGSYRNISYRDTYWEDENTTELDASGTLYNIPIYTEEDLPYGTYTVVATVAKAGTKAAGGENGSGKDFYLDGIRIMQPLNEDAENAELTEKALGAYAADGESNLDTVTLRQKLITDHFVEPDPELGETEARWPFAVMTDTNGEIIYASEYVTIGPKEEVYLYPGQSVSFSIKYWHTDGYRMHMGMKAPFGTGTVQVGQTTYELKNAADCYFDITGSQTSVVTEMDEDGNPYYVATYTFTATDKIVSLTNIKVTGNYEFALIENGGDDGDGDIIIDGSEG